MKVMITALVIFLGIVWYLRQTPGSNFDEIAKPTPKIEYDFFWQAEPGSLKLIDNTINKTDSSRVASESGCRSGINAFYYDTSNKPLGWLVIDSIKKGRFYSSRLLDGVVYVRDNRFIIDDLVPIDAKYGHQSGPILIKQFEIRKFNFEKDYPDRRSVAIQTNDDQGVFAYFEEATMSQLAEKVMNLGEKYGFKVKNAINLDGGSSSSFWSENSKISESFLSGGWWCKK